MVKHPKGPEIDLAEFFADSQNLRCCVYCRLFQPRSMFNRDHIFQQQICGWDHEFHVDCVCTHCNGAMNEAFENEIANDSIEAYLRYTNRIKTPASGKVLGRRVRLRMGKDTPYPGMLLEALPKPGLAMRPMLQVETRHRDTGDVCYYTEGDFFKLGDDDLKSREIHVIEPEGKSATRLRARVMERIPSYQPSKGQAVTVRVPKDIAMLVTIDPAAARFYCKIAVNYAAKIMGRDFVLAAGLNRIRDFVRYGNGQLTDFVVRIDQEPLLLEEKGTPRRARGLHLVTLQWDGVPGGYWLHAKVKPFNETCYHVQLCKTAQPTAIALSGHGVNWKEQLVFPLEMLPSSAPTNLAP